MLELNVKGHVKNRESQTLEFKQSFQLGDPLKLYIRTLVGMANNQGGRIVFGIQNKPHLPIGLQNDRFSSFDPKEINAVVLQYFSADIDWSLEEVQACGVNLGVIEVTEATSKPIICTKNHAKAKLREGAVYYRYRAETTEIKHAELSAILQSERDKEKLLWMNHIQKIAAIGPQAVQMIDFKNGEMEVGGKKVLIDSDLIDKLKVVKEGEFVEKKGAPALRIVGEIDGLMNSDSVYSEPLYPHLQSKFTSTLPLSSYEFQAIAWILGLKGDPRYHMPIPSGKSSVIQKYSDKALRLVREKMREDKDFKNSAISQYKKYMKLQRKS